MTPPASALAPTRTLIPAAPCRDVQPATNVVGKSTAKTAVESAHKENR